MTVKDAALRIGISTKTLSNRLMRAGCTQYRTNDTPHHTELYAVLKSEEKEGLLASMQDGVQPPAPKRSPSTPKQGARVPKAPPVDVEAIMVAVGETMKNRETAVLQAVADRCEALEKSVKVDWKGANQRLEELVVGQNEAWGEKLGKLHDAATGALEAAEQSQAAVEEMKTSRPTERGLVGILFGSEVALLVAAALLMLFGGYAYQRVVCTLTQADDWGTTSFAFFAGLVVHYAGLLNAYRKSRVPGPRYGTHPVVYWIGAFMVFECVLHGCNYNAFGTVVTPYLARFVMTVSVPLATAALADAMLTPNPQTDGTTK